MHPRWLTRAMVQALRHESLTNFGGLAGLRDEALLESALARPRNVLAYQPEVDLERLAAAYGFALARDHPFMDGNKRVAVLAIAVFLALNDRVFDPEELDEVHTVRALAAGELDEEVLAAWIAANTTGPTPGP